MIIEISFEKERSGWWAPALITILLAALLFGMVAWRVNHPQPKAPPRECTPTEKASQALALAGVAAAGNSGTAMYTPLLFASAASLKEEGSKATNNAAQP